MPISMRWVDPDAILMMDCTGHLEPEELETLTDSIIPYLDAASRPVHVISDWRNAENFPINYRSLPDAARSFRHKNMGMWAIIGLTPSLAFFAEVLTKIGGMRYRGFDTPEEAAEFLRELDKLQHHA